MSRPLQAEAGRSEPPEDWDDTPRRPRRRGLRFLVGIALIGVAVGTAVLIARVERDRPFVRLVDHAATGCSAEARRFTRRDIAIGAGWTDAEDITIAQCGGELALGPSVSRARFRTATALRADLLTDPPSDATCIDGTTVYTDGLDRVAQFRALCRKASGDLVDGVSGLPEIDESSGGPTPTYASVDRAVSIEQKRDAQIQRLALQRYFTDQGNVRSPR